MLRSSRKFFFVVFVILFVAACSSESEVDVEGTVAASLSMTQTAVPTATAVPPTDTPMPTDTPTPMPMPTDTAVPIDTLDPTFTPTSSPHIIITDLDSGDFLYELTESGFSMALSPKWEVFDVMTGDFVNALDYSEEQNETMDIGFINYLKTTIPEGVQFIAMDSSSDSLDSSFPNSINVIIFELPSEFPPDLTSKDFAQALIFQMERNSDLESQIEIIPVSIGNEMGVMFTYNSQIYNMGLPHEVLNTQYIYIQNGNAYIVTVVVSAESTDVNLQSIREVAETFRFLETGE